MPTRARFLAFVVEQLPFALGAARAAWGDAGDEAGLPEDIRSQGARVRGDLLALLAGGTSDHLAGLGETTPFVSAERRLEQEIARASLALEGFFEREAIL